MCVTSFPRDAPANGGIGAGIDQLPEEIRTSAPADRSLDVPPWKSIFGSRTEDTSDSESRSRSVLNQRRGPTIIQRIDDARITVQATSR